ncbi:uncharacterized protein KGF55_005440 [Candida pseudojiufengensis]|uniref:uncharacterized protein n=1 Tax=Candida pseudojiufengensis TaxID=497109 RepID=UPI002225A4BA|nr:uncharacterized protein KGF55_005440 [Candida pseudojiufengensis]KAI5959290.1 hypothetical protein KGF55_005440 [Candida pseudojiufengensis]
MSLTPEKHDSITTNQTELPESSLYTSKVPNFLKWIYKLDNLGIETRGIERVNEEERHSLLQQTSINFQILQVLGLWFSSCSGLTSMSSFFLSSILFNLNLKTSLINSIFAVLIGCLVPAYCSIMGSKSGCRQLVTARFLFGQWGIKFISLITIIGGIGWSIVNCVLGGQILNSINNQISISWGIIIIAVVSLIVSIFGIKILLKFQTLLAIPIFIACILFYIVVFKKSDYIHESNKLIAEMEIDPLTKTGNWLSFFTIAYAVTATWGSGASDYYILFPEYISSTTIFIITFLGISLPTIFVAIIGTICGNITLSYTPWNEIYNKFGIGGIIVETFKPWGKFGKFISVLLYLSLICNNIMNTYSIAFEFQLIDNHLLFIPRWIWVILITVIYIILSLVGREHFSTILSNFLPMLGYWITIYIVLLLEENLIFRSTLKVRKLHEKEFGDEEDDNNNYKKLYNWQNWNLPKGRTLGLASCIAFCFGVVGAILGMNQIYFIGPLAKKIGEYGGDIGMWLAFGFSGITYPILRYIELKKFKR